MNLQEPMPFSTQGLPIVTLIDETGRGQAVEQLFRQLPGDTGLVFLVAVQSDVTQLEAAAAALRQHSQLPVVTAVDGTRLTPNQIYLFPAHLRATAEADILRLQSSPAPATAVDTGERLHPRSEPPGQTGVTARERRQQQALAQIERLALAGSDLDRLFTVTAQAVTAALEMEFCNVLELQAGGQRLFLRAGVGWQEGLVGHTTVPADPDLMAGVSLQSSMPVIMQYIETDVRFPGSALLLDHNVRSGMSVIVNGSNGPFGLIGVHSQQLRDFPACDIDFLQSVANLLSLAVTRRADLSQMQFQAEILAHLNDAVIALDNDLHITYLNATAARQFALADPAKVIGRPLTDFYTFVWLTPEAGIAAAQALQQTGNWRGENIIIRRDGLKIPVESTVSQLTQNGRIVGNLAVIRDITDQKVAEEALRESEAQARRHLTELEMIYNSVPVGLCVVDTEYRWVRINERLAAINGIPAADHIGRRVHELLPTQAAEFERVFERILETRQPEFNIEVIGETAAQPGVQRTFLEGWFPILDAQGAVAGINIVVEETTARKRIEEELRYQAFLLDNVWDAIISTDTEFQIRTWNRGAEKTYGWSATEAIGQQIGDLLETTFLDTDVSREAAAEMLRTQGRWQGEVVQSNKNGTRLHISSIITLLHDVSGQVQGAVAVNRDITEYRQAEERLRSLTRISGILATSLDLEKTLEKVAQAVVPEMADWCTIDLVDEAGAIVCVALAHADPERVSWAKELRERYPIDPDAPAGAPNVIRTGVAELYPIITDEMLRAVAKNEEELRLLRTVGYRSIIVVPLRTSDRILGAITLVASDHERQFHAQDLAMAEEMAQRAAAAIGNAKLHKALQQRETLLSISEERLRLVTAAGNIGIFDYNLMNDETEYSDIFREIVGFAPGAPIGNEAWLARVHPQDRAVVAERQRRARELGESYQLEYRLFHPDGSLRWLTVSALVITDKKGQALRVAGAVHDITARKEVETALQRSEIRFRSTFEQAAVGMAHRNREGRFLLVNERLCNILGYSRAELLQMNSMAITHPDDLDAALTQIRRQWTGAISQHSMEKRYRRKDGSYIWVNMTASVVFNDAGEPEYNLVVVEDIAERKATEFALQELNATLERRIAERTAELQRSNRELDQFAYVASHDLKAPLRAIDHLAGWIAEDAGPVLPAASVEHLQKLRARAARMERLLEDLLTYSRAGRMQGSPGVIHLSELIDEVAAVVAPPAGFVITHPEQMPTLTTYHAPLALVLRNLIDNAIKHHHQATGRVHVDAIERGDFIEITVSDDGPGIAPEYHQRIFDMFQALRRRDEVEGSGMGLTILKKTVESVDGQVWVESAPGEGATFRFTWPRETETRFGEL